MTPYQVRTMLAPASHLSNSLKISSTGEDGLSVSAQQERYKQFVSGLERRLRKARRNG